MAKPKLELKAVKSPTPVTEAREPIKETKTARAAAREGRRNVSAWVNEESWLQLRHMALENRTTTQDLVVEAMNLLFENYGKPPIAETTPKKNE